MSDSARVVVVDDAALDPTGRLAEALRRCGVWEALSVAATTAATQPADLSIVIVPALNGFVARSPAATDPALVEALVDLLADAGYRNVAVCGTADESASWAANRHFYALVELLGYSFVSPAGREYDVIDLSEDTVDVAFAPGDLLAGTQLGRTWVDAAYRIVFAKNATHEVDGYSLGLDAVLGTLPTVDGRADYRVVSQPGDAVAELLTVTPVQLTLLDGVVSCHGSGGARAPQPIVTNCIVAANDPFLADAVGALKMGLDPAVSRVAKRSPHKSGVGVSSVDGSLSVYDGWVAPHPLVLDSSRQRETSVWWSGLVRPWLQVLDTELFSFESPVDARMNARLAPMFNDVDADPVSFAALVYLNYMAAGIQQWLDGYRVVLEKDAVGRVNVPLGFDPEGYEPQEYRSIVAELRSVERMLDGATEHRPGLRWRYLDEAVVFEYSKELPIAFDEFVAAVDVAQTISYMSDYIGGVVVPLEHDETGRPVRQAERNVYLPQPNYLVLSGGKPIDVGKLEIVEYLDEAHHLYWKTVASENDSAVYDDGIATFARSETGTKVTIVGRQLFALPPLWNAVDMGLNPELKAHLVTDAYATFFDRTLANLEAIVEGREIRIGRPRLDAEGAADERPVVAVEALAEKTLDWLHSASRLIQRPEGSGQRRDAMAATDADGFTHFRAVPKPNDEEKSSQLLDEVGAFWTGLLEAGLRDMRTGVGRSAQ